MRSGRGRGGPEPAQEPSALPVRRRPLGEGKEKGTDRRTGQLIPSGVVPQRPGPSPGPASAAPHLLRRPAAAAALRPSSREGRALRPAPPRECEAARSGRDEPGWGHEPRLPCLGRAASLSPQRAAAGSLGAGCRGPRGVGFSDSFILRRREPEAAGAARRGGKRGRPRAGLHCARRGPGSQRRWARAPALLPGGCAPS